MNLIGDVEPSMVVTPGPRLGTHFLLGALNVSFSLLCCVFLFFSSSSRFLVCVFLSGVVQILNLVPSKILVLFRPSFHESYVAVFIRNCCVSLSIPVSFSLVIPHASIRFQ